VQGNSVRAAFEMGTAALAGTAPSARMLHPAAEAAKFILLPAPPPARASAGGRLSMPPPPPRDPHEAVLFPPGSLWPGEPLERNPLPGLEPPYLPKPFLGRAVELRPLAVNSVSSHLEL